MGLRGHGHGAPGAAAAAADLARQVVHHGVTLTCITFGHAFQRWSDALGFHLVAGHTGFALGQVQPGGLGLDRAGAQDAGHGHPQTNLQMHRLLPHGSRCWRACRTWRAHRVYNAAWAEPRPVDEPPGLRR
ncbi:hypothetical protein G6F22_020384 [Rhizopus arrhizus]|nr:hypothetical protein G6F22_020384 [Rhizopus arrhizus]